MGHLAVIGDNRPPQRQRNNLLRGSIRWVLCSRFNCLQAYTDLGGGGGGCIAQLQIIYITNLLPKKVFCFCVKTHVFVYSTDMTSSDAS